MAKYVFDGAKIVQQLDGALCVTLATYKMNNRP